MKKELLIIGAGPGGYVAAIRAAQLGVSVTLVEGREIGGTCLNRGCISTKALYTHAQKIRGLSQMASFGIQIDDWKIDYRKIQQRKQSVVDQLVAGVEQLLEANGVEMIRGWAQLDSGKRVQVHRNDGGREVYEASHILLATGSRPSILPVPGNELPGVLNSDQLLAIDFVPEKLVIAGSGVIGIELAGIFQAFGSDVTVVSSTLLKRMDSEMVKRLKPHLKRQGIQLIQDSRVSSIDMEGGKLAVGIRHKKTGKEESCEGDILLMASGREPLMDQEGLKKAGIMFDEQGIHVNSQFETSAAGIYAIGDVLGGMMLAHVASNQGIAAVEAMFGHAPAPRLDVVPDCVFVDPQLAGVGKTEQQLMEEGEDYLTGKFMFGANGKALAMGEPEGLVKVLARREDHRLLGAHILGPHASDLIHEMALALARDLPLEAVTQTIHAHPTLSEAVLEGSLQTTGEAIHAVPPRKK